MNNKKAISLLKINPSDDGLGFTVEVPEEVETWFMKTKGLSEWSDDAFNVWFKGLIHEVMSDEASMKQLVRDRSENQTVDVWEQLGEEND